eukprot:2570777-Rhodomonas_salina.2
MALPLSSVLTSAMLLPGSHCARHELNSFAPSLAETRGGRGGDGVRTSVCSREQRRAIRARVCEHGLVSLSPVVLRLGFASGVEVWGVGCFAYSSCAEALCVSVPVDVGAVDVRGALLVR